MARSGRAGDQGSGDGRYRAASRVDVRFVLKVALVGAAVVFGFDVVLDVMVAAIDGGGVEFDSILRGRAPAIIGNAALFGAITAVVTTGTDGPLVSRGAAGVYLAGVLEEFTGLVLMDLTTGFSPGADANMLLHPLFGVTLFLGVVMTYRLHQGRAILPGISLRL